MVPLLQSDELFIAPRDSGFLSQTTHCTIRSGDGTALATVEDRAGGGSQLARAIGNSGTARYEWDVTDLAGSRLLGIVKPKELCGDRAPSSPSPTAPRSAAWPPPVV